MEMVRAGESGPKTRRALGVADQRIEVDDGVEGSALADPLVHGLPRLLLLGAVEVGEWIEGTLERVLERRERRADDLDPGHVRAIDQLAVTGDDPLDRRGRVVGR